MLICIADHLYSGRFGTFLFNNEKERKDQNLANITTSLWAYIDEEATRFSNSLYVPGRVQEIFPSSSSLLRQVRLWEGYYCRYSPAQMSMVHDLPTDLTAWCSQNSRSILAATSDGQTSVSTSRFHQDTLVALQRQLLPSESQEGADKAALERRKVELEAQLAAVNQRLGQ